MGKSRHCQLDARRSARHQARLGIGPERGNVHQDIQIVCLDRLCGAALVKSGDGNQLRTGGDQRGTNSGVKRADGIDLHAYAFWIVVADQHADKINDEWLRKVDEKAHVQLVSSTFRRLCIEGRIQRAACFPKTLRKSLQQVPWDVAVTDGV